MLLFAGCGDVSISNDNEVSVPSDDTQADTALEKEKSAIEEYEMKYASGEFAADDYKALAELYAGKGMVKKQRDMLERCYRLYRDTECLDLLKDITVNVAEEGTAVNEEAERLKMNLSTPGYLDEAVGMLLSSDWSELMMPKLREGLRRYYVEDEAGGMSLCFEIGYDEAGGDYSVVWYMPGDGSVQCITLRGNSLQMLVTEEAEGRYRGPFESWLCMGDSGEIYHETGTFEDGILTGAYTAQVRHGKEATDLFALWKNRTDMSITAYTGFFAENGITEAEQPSDLQANVTEGGGKDKRIVYAYTEDRNGYLFMNVEEEMDAASFVFDYSAFGMEAFPQITFYEPKEETDADEWTEQTVDSRDVKVRVYDSNIEWFDGSRWHVLGDVAEYMKKDPFEEYEREKGSEEDGGAAEEGKTTVYEKRGTATIKKAPLTNAGKTSKTTGSKKASPSPSPIPSTSPQPDVSAPNNNSAAVSQGSSGQSGSSQSGGNQGGSGGSQGSGNSGQNSGGNQSGSGEGQNNGGQDSGGGQSNNGGNDGGSSSGGDVDIEWTDDIL